MTKLFDPFLSKMKEHCSYEIVATHEGSGHVGMATKIFVLILHVTRDQCQSSCELHKSFCFQTQQFVIIIIIIIIIVIIIIIIVIIIIIIIILFIIVSSLLARPLSPH